MNKLEYLLVINKKKLLIRKTVNEGIHWGIAHDYRAGMFRAEISELYFPGEDVKMAKGVISEILKLTIPEEERKELEESHRRNYGLLMVKEERGRYNKESINEYVKDQGKIPWYERNGSQPMVEVAHELSQNQRYITKTGKIRWRLIAKELEGNKHLEDTKLRINAGMVHRAVNDYKRKIR